MKATIRFRDLFRLFSTMLVAALLAGITIDASTSAATKTSPGQRKALVIGNSDYLSVDRLPGAANDASDIGRTLQQLGFETKIVRNATLVELKAAFNDLIRNSKKSDTFFIFYSGHGFQEGASNYLAPIDLRPNPKTKRLENKFNLTEILPRLVSVSSVRIIFLDACRNDPYSAVNEQVASKPAEKQPVVRQTAALGDRTVITRAIKTRALVGYSNGFGRMNSTDPGTFVAYSTASGQFALDRLAGSRNSPFTTSVLKYIGQPQLDISNLITKVRGEVYQATANLPGEEGLRQLPWSESSLVNPFFFVDEARQEWIAKQLQTALKGARCYPGTIDGKWGPGSRQALARFNSANRTNYNGDEPSLEVLEALRRQATTAKQCAVIARLTPPRTTPSSQTTAPKSSRPSSTRSRPTSRPARSTRPKSQPRRAARQNRGGRGKSDTGKRTSTARYSSGKSVVITTQGNSPFQY